MKKSPKTVDLVDLVDNSAGMPQLLKQQEGQLQKARAIADQIQGLQRKLAALFGGGIRISGVPAEAHQRIVDALEATLETARTADAALEDVKSREKKRHLDELATTPKHAVGGRQFAPLAAGRKAVLQLQEAEGGAFAGSELKELYGLSPANLHKRRTEHRIVAWRDAKNEFHYPQWQFNGAGALLPGVQNVLQTFRSSDEWRVMRYFLGPRGQLADRTPLDLLRGGEAEKVVAHAKAHAEENTW